MFARLHVSRNVLDMATNRETLTGCVEVLGTEAEGRRFRMLAYTGAEIERRYGRAVAELSGIECPAKLPILLNHDEDAVVGYADMATLTPDGLVLEGPLLIGEASADRVARLSDAGFPLTASVGLTITKAEALAEGKQARCNGRDVSGPLTIWRRASLFETSFVTANPADKHTTAAALAAEAPMTPDEFLQANPDAVKAWKDEAAKAARESLMANLGALLKAIPGRPDFVLAQFSLGADVVTAKAALCDVLTAEAAEAKAAAAVAPVNPVLDALKAKAGNPGLGFSGDARETAEQLAALDPLERARREIASTEGLRGMRPEHLAAFYRAEAAGLVRADTVNRTASAMSGQ